MNTPNPFDRYQSAYPRTMAEAEDYQPEPKPDLRVNRQPSANKRGTSKHWKTHTFRATFVQFVCYYDPMTFERNRTAELSDIYMDGELLTLHWTVDCPRSLAAMCTEPGVEIEFTAEYSTTAYATKQRGPMLRPPFRPVVAMPIEFVIAAMQSAVVERLCGYVEHHPELVKP